MRILVTGAEGQLGGALAEISGRGFSDGAFPGRGVSGGTEPGKGWPGGVDWLFARRGELDVTDPAAVDSLFDGYRPDVVVNCAAFTDVDRAESEPHAAFRVNGDAPGILARRAALAGAAMVHISTDFVFDGRSNGEVEGVTGSVEGVEEVTGVTGVAKRLRPYTEQDTPAPLNVYGASKLAGERAVMASGCRGAVVRTSWLYSCRGRNFVRSILNAAATRHQIEVVADQTGSPTSAASLAGAIVRMIPTLGVSSATSGCVSSPPMDIYHFCDAGTVSRADFAIEIVRLAGLECRVVPVTSADYPSIARRPAWSALDTAKISRTFAITPLPWQETLADCIKHLQYGR